MSTPPSLPTTIGEVLARMRSLEASLPPNDGVAWFNRLYLRVTERVQAEMVGAGFRDPTFLERLDVVFAGLYFRALEAAEADPGSVPKAWAPLIDDRDRPGVAPIQFALAGMNAHINHDLPIALVETCSVLGLPLEHGSPEHADYEQVNPLLQRTEEEVKRWFATGFTGVVDEALGRADDVVALWSVARAREQAWVAGETLYALRGLPPLRSRFLLGLDRMVGLVGRAMLMALPSIPTAVSGP